MSQYTDHELQTILTKHKQWLNGKNDGVRANLSRADLSGADLRWANLRWADLSGANLNGADLREANLIFADLNRANLSRAYLSGADLREANLSRADLNGADLREANLIFADLNRADLSGAYLSGANLSRADLNGADLREANLNRANLSDETVIDTGETWKTYLSEIVPQLLLAGERGIEAIQYWDNHTWSDCPMHVAFSIDGEEGTPALLRPRIRQFVQFFDAGLIPKPEIASTEVG